jgi:hypothetical protein
MVSLVPRAEVTIKARLKTVPIQQWAVGREDRRRLKKSTGALRTRGRPDVAGPRRPASPWRAASALRRSQEHCASASGCASLGGDDLVQQVRDRRRGRMNRTVVIAVVISLLAGALGGFLLWGLPARSLQEDLRQARERPAGLERELEEARRQAAKSEAELRSAQGRLTEVEGDLAREREERGKLEAVLSRGRK